MDEKVAAIQKTLENYRAQGKSMFATSSFQSHSIPMLHIISRLDKSIPIYFLNTGFLFPETFIFKEELSELLGLKIIGVQSAVPKSQQKDENGQLLFTSDPDYCCFLNKVQPMEPLLSKYDVWINGIRADQNANRANMKEEQESSNGAMRYHPMLHWTSKEIFEYRKKYNLPSHPLEQQGYLSIGCEPCTKKMEVGLDERHARWFGLNKTECGLHTDLIKEKE